MDKIGEKIKKARNDLKLSQTGLVGEQMTKGMLSQIENNQAMPSMKNLQYIAERLGKPISYFLQEEKIPVPTDLVIKDVTSTIKKSRGNIAKEQATKNIEELEAILVKYDIDKNSKVYGDILLQYGASLNILNKYDQGEEKILEAIDIYVKNHLYLEAAKASIKLGIRYMDQFLYEQCLETINKANELYLNSFHTDNEFENEILYLKSFIYSAMGNMGEALSFLHTAIKIAKDKNVYYKPDEIYRMTAVLYLFDEKYEEFLFYINKAKQFAEITENTESQCRIAINFAIYENDMKHPEKALEYLKIYENYCQEKRFLYYLQNARAYYQLGQYEKAYEYIKELPMDTFVNHKFDYLLLWSGKVHEGLILHKLGKSDEGIEEIKIAIQKLEIFPPSRILKFAYKNISEIYSETGDFENAFKALKRSDEISFE